MKVGALPIAEICAAVEVVTRHRDNCVAQQRHLDLEVGPSLEQVFCKLIQNKIFNSFFTVTTINTTAVLVTISFFKLIYREFVSQSLDSFNQI
jgi:hypothetical protein